MLPYFSHTSSYKHLGGAFTNENWRNMFPSMSFVNERKAVTLDVLNEVTTKMAVLQDVTPCSVTTYNQRF
jgi:hypothetical protein